MTPIKNDLKKITNLDYLLGLSKGNAQFVKEMIQTFIIENPKEIESLDTAIRNKNFEAIRQGAHLLQSSIPFVGLDKIIESEVYEIESTAAGKRDIQKISQLFSKVKESCEKAREELSKPEYMKQL